MLISARTSNNTTEANRAAMRAAQVAIELLGYREKLLLAAKPFLYVGDAVRV